ncbi:MAG: hypothetical protein K8F91_08310, partial [Candidatus Obscuribacterales bacterium]|nr:hypothetical protein [Candidatus Obscuribacterales bacterium]
LKHWKQDMFAGFIVALVSVPLSLGIALASGAPPICGITSEIIAGLVFPLLGGAYVTISGPAAGLAPVLFASISALGNGDMEKGYHMVLGVIMFAGLVQILLTYLKAAKFSYLLPRSAINGMLAAIGLLIIAKQIPNFIGHKYEAHEFFPIICETPSRIMAMDGAVFATSLICLSLLFILPKLKMPVIKHIPAHLAVVLAGIALGQLFHLNSGMLVEIPREVQNSIVFPDFSALFASMTLIPTIVVGVFVLTFVDGTESLATIRAVDGLDPYKRKSNPHKTLFAMGVSNICSSLVGGLTIIPGIIKSTTCIIAGGRTAWVNFYNAMFLILFLLVFGDLIRMIPIACLSAVLVHIGYKLAGPHKWQEIFDLGFDQVLIFSSTVIATLMSDLLIGIAAGIAMKILILMYYSIRAHADHFDFEHNMIQSLQCSFTSLFKSPIGEVIPNGDRVEVRFIGPVTCFNNLG